MYFDRVDDNNWLRRKLDEFGYIVLAAAVLMKAMGIQMKQSQVLLAIAMLNTLMSLPEVVRTDNTRAGIDYAAYI